LCTRSEALAQARDLIGSRLDEFHRTERALPGLCAALGLDHPQRHALTACAELLRAWMRGHAEWGISTSRYSCLPTDPGYLEELIPDPAEVR
jgi:hypothetical protein